MAEKQCTDATNVICKHSDDSVTRFVDFTDELSKRAGVTLVSATLDTTADASLTATPPAVSTGAISTTDEHGNAYTIAVGKAVTFKLSGGTRQASYADPLRLTIAVTLSDGDVIARGLLLKVG